MDKTEAEVELLQGELAKVRSQLVSSRADIQEVNRLYNESKNDLWVTSGKLRLREEEVEALKAQLTTVTATAAPNLSPDDRATLRKLTAAKLGRLLRELETTEQALHNQDGGRKPSTEEGRTKKEQRKAELQQAIAQLQQAIAQLEEIGQKLAN